IAASEREHGDRNAALAHFMKSYGNLGHPVETVLDQ
ncbi:glutaminase, partial [Chromobacterium piscinae]